MTQEEELIQLREQVKQIPVLQEIIKQLRERVKGLEAKLAKDSHNSSLPPSSDRFTRQSQARSLRKSSGKKAGGQPGHEGRTLSMSASPDEVVHLPPVTQCEHCQSDLSEVAVKTIERRQVIDVPAPPPLQVVTIQHPPLDLNQ